MWFYIAFFSVIIITLGVLLYFFIKNKDKLASLDLESMKVHRHKEVKKRVVEDRLERKFSSFRAKVKPVLEKIFKPVKNFFWDIYRKIMRLERKYKEEEKNEPKTMEQKEIVRQNVNELIAAGEDLLAKDDYQAAEKKFIEVLSVDPQNITAYKKLADVYFEQKDLNHARETLEFIVNLNPNDEMIYRELGEVEEAAENLDKALENYQQAMALAPNNPKNITRVIEAGLALKDKAAVKAALGKLKEVNPDNQKLEEYLERYQSL